MENSLIHCQFVCLNYTFLRFCVWRFFGQESNHNWARRKTANLFERIIINKW